MTVGKITKRSVDALVCPQNAKKVILWDDGVKGFGVKVTANGVKTYLLQYRMGGRATSAKTFTIGRHGSPYTPESAKERARDLLADIQNGIDPVERERAARVKTEDDAYFEFNAFVDLYIERHVKAGELRSEADIVGTFNRDLRPRFGGRSVKDITAEDIKTSLGSIALRSQSAANKAYKWLSGLYTWGMQKDRLSASPMGAVGKPFPEVVRTRVLSKPEVRALVSVLPLIPRQFAALYLILLLTGQRLREVAGMRWEEVDLAAREWIIPPNRTKNKLPHLVPLSPQVLHTLASLSRPESGAGFVLSTTGYSAISGFSDSKEALDELLDQCQLIHGPIPQWVVHDLRRTVRTGLSELRVRTEHAEAAINHRSGVLGGLNRVYDLYEYRNEKRAALNKWGRHLETILGGMPDITASRPGREVTRKKNAKEF